MDASKRSQSACDACTLRKKACDKTLPTCAFCAGRQLPCKYSIVAERKQHRGYNVGRHFVRLEATDPLPSPNKPFHVQIQHVIQRVRPASTSEICDRYWSSFHQWLPIVSPEFLSQILRQPAEKQHPPPVDFSVLLFALWLSTTLPGLESSTTSPLTRKVLFAFAKSLFAQVQVVVGASFLLLQASLIITTCEYACLRPQAAYVSLGTSLGLAQTLGIAMDQSGPQNGVKDGLIAVENEERYRVAWATITLERMILSEMGHRLQPLTELSGHRASLTCPVTPLQAVDAYGRPTGSSKLASLPAVAIGWLGRLTQVTALLDLVLRRAPYASSRDEQFLLEFEELDRKIQALLVCIMDEDRTWSAPMATPIAVSLRALFVLHNAILGSLPASRNQRDEETRQRSLVALDTAAEIILDVIQSSEMRSATVPDWRQDHEIVSICCFYNLDATIAHLQDRLQTTGNPAVSQKIGLLQHCQEMYRRRWALDYGEETHRS